ESAGITLVRSDLNGIVRARTLARAAIGNIKQNLFFAFVYNAAGVPIAAGVLYPLLGTLVSPMLAAAAMSLSSVSVIGNSLRLRKLKLCQHAFSAPADSYADSTTHCISCKCVAVEAGSQAAPASPFRNKTGNRRPVSDRLSGCRKSVNDHAGHGSLVDTCTAETVRARRHHPTVCQAGTLMQHRHGADPALPRTCSDCRNQLRPCDCTVRTQSRRACRR